MAAASKNNTRPLLMVLLAGLAFTGCGKKELVPLDYVAWVEDSSNGLRETKVFGEIEVTAQYKPAEYVVAIEQRQTELDTKVLLKRKEDMKGLRHYMIRFSTVDKSKDFMKYDIASEEEYYAKQNYLSFGFQQDIALVEDGDTLPCVLFSCVRNYGISPNVDFAVAFESKRNTEEPAGQVLIINDQVVGVGTMKFSISKETIKSIPTIRTF
jgi:hypothetical protein